MSVNWVQDVNSKYEISSVNHLLQLMHEGALFTDTGTPPTSYLSSDYVQTVDIDLASDSANIVPIGLNSDSPFTGEYDGQNYKISNWSYSVSSGNNGLFYQSTGATISNLVLDGVWDLDGGQDVAFLVGRLHSSDVCNITTDFSAGTRIIGTVSYGVIAGYGTNGPSIHNVTIGGIIDEFSGGSNAGGVAGYLSNGTVSHVRNIATFTTGIVGSSRSGGIFGNLQAQCSHVLNAMTGDVILTSSGVRVGGLFGHARSGWGFQDVVCSMRGNIISNNSSSINGGGIAGEVSDNTYSRVLNYMTGDAAHGLFDAAGSSTLSKCVVAMNGTTIHAGIGSTSGSVEVLLDTSYGITYQFDNDTVTTMDVSSFDGVSSNGLPFISFLYTDPCGNTIDWDFIFGNIDPFSLSYNPVKLTVDFSAVPGALAYQLTIQETGGDVSIVSTGFTSLTISVDNLSPETEYTVRLLSTSDNLVYTLQSEDTFTTPANMIANYTKIDFQDENGEFDISQINSDTQAILDTVMNDIFDTGDVLIVSIPNSTSRKSIFVKRGDSYPIEDQDSLTIPFDSTSGSSQTVDVVKSDSTAVSLIYDEVGDTVTIEGVVYAVGKSTILDGRKVTIVDI